MVVSPEGRVVERSGKDLREVDLLVCSGGMFRHGRDGVAERVLAGRTGADIEGGWSWYLDRLRAALAGTPMPVWDAASYGAGSA